MSVGHFHSTRNEAAAAKLLSRANSSQHYRNYISGQRFKVDHQFDIPYLAGYSTNGATVYIDRHLPLSLVIVGKRVNILPFLITHERVEKGLLDTFDVSYDEAHNAATVEEHKKLEKMNISPRAYERALDPYIKADYYEKILRCPADLDLKPYRDSRDLKLIARMKAKMGGTL